MLKRYEEKALVGMIAYEDHRYNWANKLTADHFTIEDHKRIFNIIIENKKMEQVDLDYLIEIESEKKGFNYRDVQYLYVEAALSCQDDDCITEIYRYKRYRELKLKFDNINPNDPQDDDINALFSSADNYSEPTEDIGNGLDAYLGVYSLAMMPDKEKRKIETGFKPYDETLGGGISKGLHIIGARPNGGKTTYAFEVSLAYAKRHPNKLSVFFSMEVGSQDLWYKVVSNRTRIPINILETGHMNPAHSEAYKIKCDASQKGTEINNFIYIAAPIMDTLKAEQIIKRLVDQYEKPIGLVTFDYLQIMQPIGNKYFNDTEKVQKTSNDLRIFANKYTTIALVQVNRDGDSEECPETKHIKSSSQIEQDATTVLFLWWHNKAMCEMCSGLKKNRYGPSEIFDQLILDGPTGRINYGVHQQKEEEKKKKGNRTY